MAEISYAQMLAVLTAAWVLVRALAAKRSRQIDMKRECLLLTVFLCIAVIARVVYFPWRLNNRHVQPLHFDIGRILPLKVQLRPFCFLTLRYAGWKRNLFGNIAMFIPVGICWPLCFPRLRRVRRTVLAGFGYSLLIELSQLLLYERTTDVDDLILNTAGTLIGALIYFAAEAFVRRRKHT